jgi:UDP-glucose 4-epimerase
MARFLITGGAGFIGSHLCEALIERGHTAAVLDNLSSGKFENLPEEAEFFPGDVSDAAAVRHAMRGADGVFHLAAVASVEKCNLAWRAAHQTNLFGSVTVFEAACDRNPTAPVPVVYASSAAIYGAASVDALSESDPAAPVSAYGADKLATELHARAGGLNHRLPSVGLRFFNVYGPRQDPKSPYSGVISIFLERLLDRKPLLVYGDGKQSRDFIYVGDVVRFLLAAMKKASVQAPVFNVCTGKRTSILDLISALNSDCHAGADLSFAPPRTGDIRNSCGNPAAAQQHLGVTASVGLHEGLMQTRDSLLCANLQRLAS